MSAYHTPRSESLLAEGQVDGVPHRARPNASRRRDKPQLSCNYCRRRKSRCDRKHPCSTCQARSIPCTYAENRLGTARAEAHAMSLPDRLAHLEWLVMHLNPRATCPMGTEHSNGAGAAASSARDTPDGQSECGSMRVSGSEVSYVGSDHWAAIMESISDLRDRVDREEPNWLGSGPHDTDVEFTTSRQDSAPCHALLLYGCRRANTRAEILASLPPKEAVDEYISRYFERVDLVASVVHAPTLRKEYSQFWVDPYGASITWVGLLFSMMCLSLLASSASSESASYEAEQQRLQIELYREKTVQCLIMGEYTNGGPYVLETMIHYIYLEFGIRADAHKDVSLLLALEVKLAMRMGYHRDPSHFPDISPFDGEMRRRVWESVMLGDVLISSQMGMPRTLSQGQWDTTEPRNLNDDDLDEDITEIPASRPESEFTTALSAIARRRITVVLGQIADLAASVKPVDYAEVMRLDRKLQEAAANIPLSLKETSLETSAADPPRIILARMFIAHLIHRGQIMLHRRFLHGTPLLTLGSKESLEYSKNACIDASLGALRMQRMLENETQPGGKLRALRWRVTSSMNHQFLTGTMILCSLLYRGMAQHRRSEIVSAIRGAWDIWLKRSCISREADQAARAVGLVLDRMGEGQTHREGGPGANTAPNKGPTAGSRTGTFQGNTGFSTLGDDTCSPELDTAFVNVDNDIDGMDLHEWMLMDGPAWAGI